MPRLSQFMRTILLGAFSLGSLLVSSGCRSGGSDGTEQDETGPDTTDEGEACVKDSECDDGSPCTGEETCERADSGERTCRKGKAVSCAEGEECDDESGVCVASCDQDQDGHESEDCGGDDCDDHDPDAFPGNIEVCTDRDGELDPDTVVHDEDCDPSTLGDDADEDGFERKECGNRNEQGIAIFGLDCDDQNDLRRPGLVEVCDGLDNDCLSGLDFPGEDNDEDGFADCKDLADSPLFDCNDKDESVHPAVKPDVCDGVDRDCDGSEEDADEDGFISAAASCVGGAEKVDCNDDPDEGEQVNPDGVETCNGLDDDCNGVIDDGDAAWSECGAAAFEGFPICAVDGPGCDVACIEGHGNCDADLENGCETNLLLSPTDCGACGNDSCVFGCNLGSCLKAVDVAAGAGHSCAVLETGRVVCWGSDRQGQLGDGVTSHQDGIAVSSVFTVGLPGPAVAVDAGNEHTCAVLETGDIACWGSDRRGQLGDGNDNEAAEPSPVLVALPDMAVSVTTGATHSCAVLLDGQLYCWGADLGVGDGSANTDDKYLPVRVELGAAVLSADAGWDSTCAVLGDGAVRCWGDRVGGFENIAHDPLLIEGLGEPAVQVGVGYNSACARLASGQVACWGSVQHGQLGNGSDGPYYVELPPSVVQGLLEPAQQLDVGSHHACVVTADNKSYCWGADDAGQIGDGPVGQLSQTTPARVVNLTEGVVAVAAGAAHSCALLSNGLVRCWGYDDEGGLGDGEPLLARDTPVDVQRGMIAEPYLSVAVGEHHSSALSNDGRVLVWGYGEYITGEHEDAIHPAPEAVVGVSDASQVATLAHFFMPGVCALLKDGSVSCWGDVAPWAPPSPTQVSGFQGRVVQLVAGAQHICALLRDGTVQCVGSNANGEGGFGAGISESNTTLKVVGLSAPAIRLMASERHTCALLLDQNVECWGASYDGELGGAASNDNFEPVALADIDGTVASMSVGLAHLCVALSTGGLQCWGSNRSGQLGDGEADNDAHSVPVSPMIKDKALAVACGGRATCALLESREVQCWGENDSDQLGFPSEQSPIAEPSSVVALAEPATSVAIGLTHGCALLGTGRIQCWGENGDGALGAGVDVMNGPRPGIPVFIQEP